jgi:putative endonuclease
MYFVYILYSPASGKTYTGYTTDLERRLNEHNFSEVKGFTLRYRPWILIHTESFSEKTHALKKEKFYKSGQGREILKSLVKRYLETH